VTDHNWQTRIVVAPPEGEIQEYLLNFETAWIAEGFITFKSYDEDGNVVTFSIAEDEFWAEVERLRGVSGNRP